MKSGRCRRDEGGRGAGRAVESPAAMDRAGRPVAARILPLPEAELLVDLLGALDPALFSRQGQASLRLGAGPEIRIALSALARWSRAWYAPSVLSARRASP